MEIGNNKNTDKKESSSITRKEAIKKAGYAAFSAATMMLLLNDPARAQSGSDDEGNPGIPDPWEEFDV
jgi:hypothetical protein